MDVYTEIKKKYKLEWNHVKNEEVVNINGYNQFLIDGIKKMNEKGIEGGEKYNKRKVAQILSNNPMMDSEASADSIERKWLRPDSIIDREKAFYICLVLQLTIDESKNFFDNVLKERWIFIGNYKELILDFCIRKKYSLEEANYLYSFTQKRVLGKNKEEGFEIREAVNELRTRTYSLRREYDSFIINIENRRIDDFEVFVERNVENFHLFSKTPVNEIIYLLHQNNGFYKKNYLTAKARSQEKICKQNVNLFKLFEDIESVLNVSYKVPLYQMFNGKQMMKREIFLLILIMAGQMEIEIINDKLELCGYGKLNCNRVFDLWVMNALNAIQEYNSVFEKDKRSDFDIKIKRLFLEMLQETLDENIII